MGRPRKYSDELRRRAIDEVLERDRRVPDVAKQLGITSPETLRRWVIQARVDRGLVTGPSTEELAEIKALRREGGRPAAHDRDPQGGDHLFRAGGRPATAVMVSFVDEHRDVWPVAVMCRPIGLPERTFHAHKTRPPSARSISDAVHAIEIRRVWTSNYSCYGPRRVYKKLRKEGYVIARCTVTRMMADIGLRGVQRGRKQFTTVPDESSPRPADLVERQFVADRPNQLWLADITYVSTWQGWLYVAFVLDVHSRTIVGWQLANHLRTDLVLDALNMALWRRDLTLGDLIHHSDRGSQYLSFRYSDRLAEVNVSASVGSRGDSYDNAMIESLNGTFKAELIKLHGPWRTRDATEIAIIEWIDWYNAVRLHGEIGDIPPAEHEADWYRHNPAAREAVTT